MSRKHGRNVRVALVVMMSVFASVVVARAKSPGDEWTTIKVKSALYSAEGVRAAEIGVDTSNGRVTLSGKVRSEKDKARATKDVKNVEGVVQVRNLLQVVAPRSKKRVQRSDTVRPVNDGVTVLGGTASSSNDIVIALRSSANRLGVRRVFSGIEAGDAFAVPSGARDLGVPLELVSSVQHDASVAGDDLIRRHVETALQAQNERENENIHVRVKDGVVLLTGTVPTWDENGSRVYAVGSVTGVRSVVNGLRVVALNLDR
jgi:osmotically-inducible protein OsmY